MGPWHRCNVKMGKHHAGRGQGNVRAVLVVVPYALDTNDIRFWRGGLNHGEDFLRYLRDAFDMLYEEGATCPRMMSVGLHCRIAGRPARAAGLDRFLAEVRAIPGVWFARRSEIARWWLDHAPPS